MTTKRLFLLLCLTIPSSIIWAQGIEITPSYGIQFGSKLNYGPNYIKIEDSDQFGLNIAYELSSDLMAEISYIHHSTELTIRDIGLSTGTPRLSDLNADWFLIGASKYFKNDKVRPFAGGGFGLVFLAPKNENFDIINRGLDNQTKFTFSFKAGVNVMLSKAIGINLQGNILLPIEWGSVYVGGGSGGVSGGVGVAGSTIIAGFSGGLVFRLDN